MRITSRFTIAVHALLCIHAFQDRQKVTSDFIASSVNVNPVIIRRIIIQLHAAGLIAVARGAGGSTLARKLRDVTLLDVYNAVESVEGSLFNFHESPNPKCPVGKNIHKVLDRHLLDAMESMERSLRAVTLADLAGDLARIRRAG